MTEQTTNREHVATSDLDVPVCDRCEGPVDPAKHQDEFGGYTCDNCMEAAYEREQERLMECGPGPTLLEQAQQGYKDKHGLR